MKVTISPTPKVKPKVKFDNTLPHTEGESKVWSTWSYYNTLVQDMLSVPSVSVDEQDTDRDGLTDQLNITLQVVLLTQHYLTGQFY